MLTSMGDENPIRTLGDYSRPSHEGYRNTIELPDGNNVVPLRSDTIRLVQNGCSFHGLQTEDPNQHLKDYLKLVDSLDLDVANRKGCVCLGSYYSFPCSILSIGKHCNTRNDILMFQQHQGESLSEAWTPFKDLLQKVPHHGIDIWLQVQIFYYHVNPATRRTIDQAVGGKLRDKNAKESSAILEDLALYDNKSWNDLWYFAKPVKAISLPQDVPSTSNRINGPHDTQYCMENPEKAFVDYASSCTDEAEGKWYTFKPKQNNLGDTYNPSWKSQPNLSFMASQDARLSKFEANFKQQQGEMANKIDTFLKAINDRITRTLPYDTVKNLKLNVNSTSLVLSARSYPTKDPNAHPISTECKTSKEVKEEKGDPEKINTNPPSSPDPSISFITKKVCKFSLFLESLNMVPRSSDTKFVCTKENNGVVMFIEIIKKYNDSFEEEPGEDESIVTGGFMVEYFDIFLTKSELIYHKYLMCGPIPSLFLRNPCIVERCPSNLNIPCNIGYVHVEKTYIDLNSPLNVKTRMQYN
ncbi:hypothetical protein Tco_1027847 [Tanacetum coccineum]